MPQALKPEGSGWLLCVARETSTSEIGLVFGRPEVLNKNLDQQPDLRGGKSPGGRTTNRPALHRIIGKHGYERARGDLRLDQEIW